MNKKMVEGPVDKIARAQLEPYPELRIGKTRIARIVFTRLPRPASAKFVRYAVLVSILCIIATKISMLLLGVVDPTVGLYEIIIISSAFMPFLFAFTRYKDPSVLTENTAEHDQKATNTSLTMPRTSPPESRSVALPLVSVVIPVFNENRLIRRAAEGVLNSSYPNIEIIIVDDCSTDGSGELIDSIKEHSPAGKVKVIHLETNQGKRRAIREGLIQGKAAGQIFVFMDSDCIVNQYAIERLVKAFADSNLGAIAGHGKVLDPDKNALAKFQDAWYDGQFSIMKGMESTFGTVTCCPGILSAYRREAVLPCLERWCTETFLGRPFDSGDDRQMTSYVLGGTRHYINPREKAWEVKYCQSAVVETDAPPTLRQFMRQQIRWKKSWIRAFVFTLPFFYKGHSPFAVVLFYIQLASSFIAPIVAFRSLVILPIEGVYLTALSYLTGVLFVDLLFAIEYRLRNPNSGDRWSYRLLFSLLSIVMLDWLLFYSLLTIRNNSWLTRVSSSLVMKRKIVA